MGARYDVAARLAEGRPVVDDVTEYVAACRQVGYQHPDLDRVAEYYDAQAGLSLDALDADIAALRAAASSTDGVVREQAAALVSLREGWTGTGAAAAIDFLNRQQRTGEQVSAAVHGAAEALTALHDDLWRAVDAQVTATLDVGAGVQGRRGAWLAAARALTSGTGDRAAASELVDLEVTPFVDGVIGGRWAPAMRAASDAVAAAYEAALARLGGPGAVFEVPFGFVPAANPVAAPAVPVPSGPTAVPAGVSPAAFSARESVVPSAGTVPASVPQAESAAQPLSPAPLPADPGLAAPAGGGMPTGSMPSMPSLPSLGDAGGLGSGATGFGSGLADLLSGLQADPADVEPDLDEELDVEDPEEESIEEEPEGEASEENLEEEQPTEEESVAESPEEVPPAELEPEPTPTPPAEPLAAVPLPPPAEAPPEPTPCEIAADELPQVGE